MTDLLVNGSTFGIDDEDLTLIEGGSLHVRRGGHNRTHDRYLYVRFGGVGKPEFSVARLILGLGHNDRTVQADHIDRDTTNNHRSNLRAVTPQQQAVNRGGPYEGTVEGRCARGHAWDESNTYITPSTGQRMCRACHRRWSLDSYYRRKQRKEVRS